MTFENKQWAAAFVGIASIEAALLYKLIVGQTSTELIIAVCIVGILLLLSSRLDALASISMENKQWAAAFVGIASIEAALLYKLIVGKTSTELIIAVCIVGILLLLSSRLDALASISMGKEGFKAELRDLRKRISENERAIIDLIFLSMGDDAYINLKKLATGHFGKYEKPPDIGLETELYHLRNLGYVVLKENVKKEFPSIRDIPPEGPKLLDFVEATPAGKKYVELREKYEADKRGQS